MPANSVIQGLWVGDELSTLERLSVASFLRTVTSIISMPIERSRTFPPALA